MTKPYKCNQLADHAQGLQACHHHVKKEPYQLISWNTYTTNLCTIYILCTAL